MDDFKEKVFQVVKIRQAAIRRPKEKNSNFYYLVFKAVKKIPKGKTATYKEVAVLAGRPRAWRAVGNILAQNFNPKIPCHRVIRSDGKIGGYNRGVLKKKLFLEMERNKQVK